MKNPNNNNNNNNKMENVYELFSQSILYHDFTCTIKNIINLKGCPNICLIMFFKPLN